MADGLVHDILFGIRHAVRAVLSPISPCWPPLFGGTRCQGFSFIVFCLRSHAGVVSRTLLYLHSQVSVAEETSKGAVDEQDFARSEAKGLYELQREGEGCAAH